MATLIQLSRAKIARRSSGLWEALNEFFAFTEPRKLSPGQQPARLAYHYAGSIELGRHEFYFTLAPQPEYPAVVAGLTRIKAAEQATILSAALYAVQHAGEQAPPEEANRFAAGVDRADLEIFDQAFANCKKTIPQCLLDYVATYEADFIQWRA